MREKALGCLCAVVGVMLSPFKALADEGSEIPSFSVSIRSEGGRRLPVEVRGVDAERGAPPIARCTTPCTLELQEAVYRVDVHGGSDGELRRKLDLQNETNLWVTRKDNATHTAGLVLGVTGPAMLLSGLVLLAASTGFGLGTGDCSSPTWEAYLGASLGVAGLIATPTGWIMFATSKARIKDVTSATTAGRPTFAVVPVRGGVGLSGGFAF